MTDRLILCMMCVWLRQPPLSPRVLLLVVVVVRTYITRAISYPSIRNSTHPSVKHTYPPLPLRPPLLIVRLAASAGPG